MDIRNVQKSGNAFYVYLPSSWCKEHKLSGGSKVSLDVSSDDKLIISPHVAHVKENSLILHLQDSDLRIINKLIVASYLNPVRSFKIKLSKEITSFDILDHKKLLSGIELVEFGDKQISCESSMFVDDPDILLRTMIKKITNMLRIMSSDKNRELILRYEEEIDRSNILINKSAITSFMFRRRSKLRQIELFYVAKISVYLERMADSLIEFKGSKRFFQSLMLMMKTLESLLETLNLESVIEFSKGVLKLEKSGDFGIISNLNNISDVLMDWAVSNEIEHN